jgi:hypothetical protein
MRMKLLPPVAQSQLLRDPISNAAATPPQLVIREQVGISKVAIAVYFNVL